MGFTASDPVKDYDGPSLDRVVFVREIPLFGEIPL
jgi:hypothetical protein